MDCEGFEELGRFFIEHNPFAIKNEKSKILRFDTYTDVYLYVLKLLKTYCSRGYIDQVVLVHKLTQNPAKMCEDINEKMMKQVKTMREPFLMVDWSDIESYRYTLRDLMLALHCITDSEFSSEHYQVAWLKFKEYLKNEKENENKQV